MNDAHGSGNGFFRSRSNLVLIAFLLIGGFFVTRDFVRRKLRFVDAVQRPSAPLIAENTFCTSTLISNMAISSVSNGNVVLGKSFTVSRKARFGPLISMETMPFASV